MSDLNFAVVESRSNRLTQEILNELPNASVRTVRQLDELEDLIGQQLFDGVIIDSEAVGGGAEVVRWMDGHPLACGVLLTLHDLDVPGLRPLYLSGKVEVIGIQHANADKLVRALRHAIEKRRLSLRAEIAAYESDQMAKTLAALSEHTEGAFLVLDRTGTIMFVNSAAVKLFGVEEYELLGEHFEHAFEELKKNAAANAQLNEALKVEAWTWNGMWLGENSTFVHLRPVRPEVRN